MTGTAGHGHARRTRTRAAGPAPSGPAVWVVDPRRRTATVHTAAGARELDPDDVLEGDPVLPGFRVAVRELFP